jgi:hypothetical protein
MPLMAPGKSITTTQPSITIPGGMQPGKYLFQLEVVDATGRRSAPARKEVTIVRTIGGPGLNQ